MEIIIYLYDGFTALDAIGPYEVLSRLPNAEVKFVSNQKGLIESDTGYLKIATEFSISEVDKADILLIPGSVISFLKVAKDKTLLRWIRKVHETTSWTTSVCSGSIILGASGLLSGLKATSHWATLPLLEEYGSMPSSERYVLEGKIITAQGVSAGIDMSLFLASKMFGDEIAKSIQLFIEYNPKPPFDSGDVQTASEEIIRKTKVLLQREAKKQLSFIDLLKNAKTLFQLKGKY